MTGDPYHDPRCWRSPAEIAALKLPGLPRSKSAVCDLWKREAWDSRTDAQGRPLVRARRGRGGGKEAHEWALPEAARDVLARRRLRAEPATPAPVARDPNAPMLTALPARKRSRAEARLMMLAAVDAYARSAGLAATTAERRFADAYNRGEIAMDESVREIVPRVHWASIAGWRRRNGCDGAGALGGRHRGRRESGIIERSPALRELIESQLLSQPHLSSTQILENCRARLPEARLPGLRRLQKWIERWKRENKSRFLYATDPDAWRSRYQPAFGSASEAVTRINQLWELDATPADVMCTDGRHVVVGVVDVLTRRAMVLVSKTSKAVAVTALMRRAIVEWGVPEVAKTDNGKDFTARHVARALKALDIVHDLCPAFTPEAKPHIERFFGTLTRDLFERCAGYVGHNVAERQAIRARQSFAKRLGQDDAATFRVALTAADLQAACDTWCAAVYERRSHSKLGGRSPFELAAAHADGERRIADERALDVLLAEAPGDGGFRTVSNKGLRIDRGLYVAPELAALVGARVQVRYDAADLGRVYVFDADGRFVCIAEDPERLGTDRAAHAAAARAVGREQTRRFREEERARRRDHRPEELAAEVLARAAAEADVVVAFPARAEEHATAALEEAARAVVADAPVAAPQLDPEQAARVDAMLADMKAATAAPDYDARPHPTAPSVDLAAWITDHPHEATGEDRGWLETWLAEKPYHRDALEGELYRRRGARRAG